MLPFSICINSVNWPKIGQFALEFFFKHQKWPNCGQADQSSVIHHVYIGVAELWT